MISVKSTFRVRYCHINVSGLGSIRSGINGFIFHERITVFTKRGHKWLPCISMDENPKIVIKNADEIYIHAEFPDGENVYLEHIIYSQSEGSVVEYKLLMDIKDEHGTIYKHIIDYKKRTIAEGVEKGIAR